MATARNPKSKNNVMKVLDVIAVLLLIIGGLNWGLVGFFDFNLVAAIFGNMTAASRFIYAIVGLAALYRIFLWRPVAQRLAGCEPLPKSI